MPTNPEGAVAKPIKIKTSFGSVAALAANSVGVHSTAAIGPSRAAAVAAIGQNLAVDNEITDPSGAVAKPRAHKP
jgi:hypothetical protein